MTPIAKVGSNMMATAVKNTPVLDTHHESAVWIGVTRADTWAKANTDRAPHAPIKNWTQTKIRSRFARRVSSRLPSQPPKASPLKKATKTMLNS